MPESRKRKPKPGAGAKSRAHHPMASGGPVLTPSLSAITAPVSGLRVEPEVKILDLYLQLWQEMTTGRPAAECIAAVACIRDALADLDVETEAVPVVVTAQWPGGIDVTVGAAEPTWRTSKEWTGHLGLWVPGLRRFIDPTIYQANIPGAPRKISRALMIKVQHLAVLPSVAIPKDGALLRYTFAADPDGRWWTGMPARGRDAIAAETAVLARGARQYLAGDHLREAVLTATFPPMVTALERLGIRP
jgi:hypothetical protein